MDITIIVPCHNGEEYIKNLLVSFHLLNLQGLTYEIVFVLDDCTDNTEQVTAIAAKVTGFSGDPMLLLPNDLIALLAD